MRTIIAGSRTIRKMSLVREALNHAPFLPTEIVSGGAPGVDRLGELWGLIHHVPVKYFPADWKRHGKRAGYVRNREMAVYAQALIAVWDGKSSGTRDMIKVAQAAGLKVFVWVVL